MLGLTINKQRDAPLRVLCLGAHSDDIEIGCGGTILRLARDYPRLSVDWVVFSAAGQREPETLASASQFLADVKDKRILVKDFRDGFFPYIGGEIKEQFEALKRSTSPDLILTHYRSDAHQDHRLICELTWNTFRDHFILEYEIPKYDGDLGGPNLFVPLEEALCRAKVRTILECFDSQRDRHWFTEDTFLALLRLRGVESRSPSGFAEAFYCRKVALWPQQTACMSRTASAADGSDQ